MLYVEDLLQNYKIIDAINYKPQAIIDALVHSEPLKYLLKEKLVLPKISYSDFIKLLNEIELRYDKSLIAAGESVGVIAAQSIGESLTQATLNSFHNTGVKKAGLTGISRLTELLDTSSTPNVIQFTGIQVLPSMKEETYDSFFPEKGLVYCKEHGLVPYFKSHDNKEIRISVTPNMSLMARKHLLYCTKQKLYCGIQGVIEVAEDRLYLKPKQKVRITLKDFDDFIPGIDLTKICCNDLKFITSNFGIEAGRQLLYNEIRSVLENEGINVDHRHISLLVDTMSFSGSLQATRYGSINIKESPILKATFQQGTSTFALAASTNTTDYLKSISSQILTGKKASIGSNCVKLIEQKVEKKESKLIQEEEFEDTIMYDPENPKMDIDKDLESYIIKSPQSFYEPINSPIAEEVEPDFDI